MTKVMHDSEIAAHGQQVITACAFMHQNIDGVDKLFLARRAATKKFFPDMWELPGGHIDFGETVEDGLRREIKEELGVEVSLGDPFAVFTYINDVKGSHSVEIVYFAKLVDPPEAIALAPEDHSDAGWFTEDEAVGLKGDAENEEVAVIRKGFSLLENQGLNFA